MIPLNDDQCRFDFNIFEAKVIELVKERLGDGNHIMSATPKSPEVPRQCNTFVVAKLAVNFDAPPTIFRSYYAEGGLPSKCPI